MFHTLELLENVLDAEQRSNDFLVLAQVADPPKRGAKRSPNNCEQMAAALGFKRPAKPWDALAMGRRRYCFDTLIMGMSMEQAIGDMYSLSFDGFARSGAREAMYARFVDIVRLNAASIFFVPPPDSLHVALAVRSHSRRIVNRAEVLEVLAMVTGSTPLLIDFERLSVQEMLTALLPIQLLVGMYGSGLMNGMFICNLGEPRSRTSKQLALSMFCTRLAYHARRCTSMKSCQGCAYFADCPRGRDQRVPRPNGGREYDSPGCESCCRRLDRQDDRLVDLERPVAELPSPWRLELRHSSPACRSWRGSTRLDGAHRAERYSHRAGHEHHALCGRWIV
jgi:hypothetical protein